MLIRVSIRRFLTVFAAYGAALLVCLLLLAWVLRLWRADLTVPFSYSADTLLVQMWVKGLIDNPVNRTKSVAFTQEGLARAMALRDAMFKKQT